MSAVREQARQAIDVVRAPRPDQDGTLNVTGVPAAWPPLAVARYVVRAALELGCARIAVHHPTRAPVVFDVVDVVNGVARAVGYWPSPKIRQRVPGPLRGFALAGFRGLGSGIERARKWVQVPGAFAGLNPPPKEG